MPVDQETIVESRRPEQCPETLERVVSKQGALYYEVFMLIGASRLLQQTARRLRYGDPVIVITHDAALESFLLHYRTLRDFLYPPPEYWTRFDSLIAWDFDHGWLAYRPDWSECSTDERDRINKLLAHVSYSRDLMPRSWPSSRMQDAIRNAMESFVGKLDVSKRQWFNDLMELFFMRL